jgi:serine/threonine-protein kinase HipA
MAAGSNHHYRIDEVLGRHFVQTAKAAGLGPTVVEQVLVDIKEKAMIATDAAWSAMPDDFASEIHDSVRNAIAARLPRLDTASAELCASSSRVSRDGA